jgi:hypothetical protein
MMKIKTNQGKFCKTKKKNLNSNGLPRKKIHRNTQASKEETDYLGPDRRGSTDDSRVSVANLCEPMPRLLTERGKGLLV